MKSITIVLAVCVCSAIAAYIPSEDYTYSDEADQVYVLPAMHRFRRQAPRGNVGLEFGHNRNNDAWGRTQNTYGRADVSYDFYRSRDGNTRLTGNAYHQRNWGSSPSRDTGAGINVNHDFYRSRDGNTRLTGNAYHQRNWGSSPSRGTGAGITFRHRF